MEGISPDRAAAEASPDRTHRRNFPPRERPTPENIFRTWPTPEIFQREGMTSKYFPNQYVASAEFFCRERSAFFDTASSREREREHAF